jgi:hypothetical protein
VTGGATRSASRTAAPASPAKPAVRTRSHRRTAATAPPPRLRLGAVRRAVAFLTPSRSAAAPASDASQRLLLTIAGATLLALAAAGTVTLSRSHARTRA